MLLQFITPRHLVIVAAALLGAMCASTIAQVVQPRQVAALSGVDSGSAVWETSIAVPPPGWGGTQAMAVYHVNDGASIQIGYALATLQGESWVWTQEGIINDGQQGIVTMGDPSVAYDAVTGEFLVCALHIPGSEYVREIVLARWNGSSFAPWQVLHSLPFLPESDKPWIVAGHMVDPDAATPLHEFYIFWTHSQYLAYLYSKNGGATWSTSCSPNALALTDPGNCSTRIFMEHWPVPRVYSNRPVYVAYMAVDAGNGSKTVGIVRGDDITSGPHANQVRFTELIDPTTGQPIRIVLNRARDPLQQFEGIAPRLPGGSAVLGGPPGVGVDFAVDPTSANRLFLVYHDTATADAGDIDVNIYLQKLTRDDPIGEPDYWTVHPRVLVADDDEPANETDQFMPSIVVDALGKLHVVFYSDRGLPPQDDGAATPQPKFNCWYAFSDSQGSSWTNQDLVAVPPSLAVDFAQPATAFKLRDYIGIAAGADRVLTSFMGINALDTNPNKSLIWSSEITRQ